MTLATALKDKTQSGGVLIKANGGAMQYGTAYCNGSDIFLTAGITFQNESNEEDVEQKIRSEDFKRNSNIYCEWFRGPGIREM